MSGSSVTSTKKSYKSYIGDNKKTGGYTGDEELKEFTFTIGVANATGRFLKAKNRIAEMAGRKLGDDIYVGSISVGFYGGGVRPMYWVSQWRRMTQGCSSHVAFSRM